MFSTSEIVRATSRKSFERGSALFAGGNALRNTEFRRLGDGVEIYGEVASSSGIADCFHSTLECDKDCEALLSSSCDCPAARKQTGLCKHCVALALAFKNDPASFDGYEEFATPKTSRSMRLFLETAPDFDTSETVQKNVHLEVELINNFGSWSLRLKIGNDHVTYVIADIEALVHAMSNRTYYEYGKRLGFVHTIDAFSENSAELVRVISQLSAFKSDAVARRELALSEDDVVRVLDALGDKPFMYVDASAPEESVSISVHDGNPNLALRILPDDGGYVVVRDININVVASAGVSYVFYDGNVYRTTSDFSEAAHFLHDVYQSSDDEIFISAEDANAFCRKVLPGIEDAISLDEPPEFAAMKPVSPAFSFYLDREGRGKGDAITLEAKVRYNDAEFSVLGGADECDTFRDDTAEAGIIHLVENYFECVDGVFRIPLVDEELAGQFLYGGVAELQKFGEVYTTPAFERLLNDRALRVQIGLSISGNLINLDVHSTDVSSEELAAILASVQKKKHFHKLKNGAIASLADLDLRDLERLSREFGVRPEDVKRGSVELPLYHAFYLDREFAEAERHKDFTEYIDSFTTCDESDFKPPAELLDVLRPYQVDGFKWLSKLASIGFGGILADEMGLGKSLQLITYLGDGVVSAAGASRGRGCFGGANAPRPACPPKGDGVVLEASASEGRGCFGGEERDCAPALIVAPASLVYNWQEEFAKFAPNMRVCVIDGDKASRRAKRNASNVDVFVASYDSVRLDIDSLAPMDFSTVVLDEAQYIKNQATKTSRAVRRLKAQHRFALTGTPIENRLSEIWSIFDFLMPGFLGTYVQFKRRFEIDIMGGDEEVAARLKSLIEPFVLRRLKEDVLTELPPKQETVVAVPLEGEQEKLYLAEEQNLRETLLAARKARKSKYAHNARTPHTPHNAHNSHNSRTPHTPHKPNSPEGLRVDVLAELMRLRQLALDPALAYEGFKGEAAKTRAILDLVVQAMDSGRKALVFSQFTSYLDILKTHLDRLAINYYEITGATDKRKRIDLVTAFNNNDIPVFLVSLKAGGTGLNLTGASVVIHADPWWNAAAINQATDRAHRIGQENMVSVYKVIAKNTIEERILKLQESKRQLADSVVGETSFTTLSSLTREELEQLLLYN